MRELGETRLLKEFGDGVAAALDLLHGFGEFSFAEKDRSLGARVHHEDVGTKLLEAPDDVFAFGMRDDKVKKIEVALRVANHAQEIVDLKEAEVAVIILDAFLLQLGALLRGELVGFAAFFGARGAALMIGEQ